MVIDAAFSSLTESDLLPSAEDRNELDGLFFSALILGGAKSKTLADRILTADDIANLNCPSLRLVTIGACNSGLGPESTADGVFNLQTGFHLAGAANVVGTLWTIDDEMTASLMEEFYHRYWLEKQPPMVALRNAQLAMYRSPPGNPPRATRLSISDDHVTTVADPEDTSTPMVPKRNTPPKYWAPFVLSGTGGLRSP